MAWLKDIPGGAFSQFVSLKDDGTRQPTGNSAAQR